MKPNNIINFFTTHFILSIFLLIIISSCGENSGDGSGGGFGSTQALNQKIELDKKEYEKEELVLDAYLLKEGVFGLEKDINLASVSERMGNAIDLFIDFETGEYYTYVSAVGIGSLIKSSNFKVLPNMINVSDYLTELHSRPGEKKCHIEVLTNVDTDNISIKRRGVYDENTPAIVYNIRKLDTNRFLVSFTERACENIINLQQEVLFYIENKLTSPSEVVYLAKDNNGSLRQFSIPELADQFKGKAYCTMGENRLYVCRNDPLQNAL